MAGRAPDRPGAAHSARRLAPRHRPHARGRPRQRPVLVSSRAPALPGTGARDRGDRPREARARVRDRARRGARMTENRLRARAERGEVQLGTWITMIRTPGVLTLLQAAGLD